MRNLPSKIQYQDYETGEFVEEQQRTYEEVIDLINHYPWQKQHREGISIDLTNPSVTIAKPDNEFLKLAIYYKGTFVLHYLNKEGALYSKSFLLLTNAYSYIRQFYEDGEFNVDSFRKENTWMQHVLKHFITKDFVYTVTNRSAFWFFTKNVGPSFLILLVMACVSLIAPYIGDPKAFLILVIIAFVACSIPFILFFTYYALSKNKTLIISKGNNDFYYGENGELTRYNKDQIAQVIYYGSDLSKIPPATGFSFVRIKFKDGSQINITSPLLSGFDIMVKLGASRSNVYKIGIPFLFRE